VQGPEPAIKRQLPEVTAQAPESASKRIKTDGLVMTAEDWNIAFRIGPPGAGGTVYIKLDELPGMLAASQQK
jgi:hypothetical protein